MFFLTLLDYETYLFILYQERKYDVKYKKEVKNKMIFLKFPFCWFYKTYKIYFIQIKEPTAATFNRNFVNERW